MSEPKRLLVLDFDGVIHSYTSGWLGADQIPDAPVPGAFDAISRYLEFFRVAVFSARSTQPGGIQAMKNWFQRQGWPGTLKGEGFEPEGLEFPAEKGAAHVTLDDRAILFSGIFPDVERLAGFRTWQQIPDDHKPGQAAKAMNFVEFSIGRTDEHVVLRLDQRISELVFEPAWARDLAQGLLKQAELIEQKASEEPVN